MPTKYQPPPCRVCQPMAASEAGYSTICTRCAEKERIRQVELEREELQNLRQQKQPEPKPRYALPVCGSCLTTLHVRDVDRDTNMGTCLKCKTKNRPKAWSWAESYGIPPKDAPAYSRNDPNKIY